METLPDRVRSDADSFGAVIRQPRRRGGAVFGLIVALVTAVLPLLFREVILYKFGVVMIFFVAAIGLHVLVNWTGQLSLAHTATVGMSAFTAITISEIHGISPIYLIPVAVMVGTATGAIVALPTLRARGMQVALVTFIAGYGIDRFFFTKPWLIGDAGGRAAEQPTLGPIAFVTNRSLYPVLVFFVALAMLVAWVLMNAKMARAWYWIRADVDAASAAGIPVVRYRITAYAVSGAFGGLAGGLSTMWIQRLTPSAFPTSLSFTYLMIVVLAGSGYLGGVAGATWVLQGGPLFASHIFGLDAGKSITTLLTYGGPLGLISMLAQYQTGLNGFGRRTMERVRAPQGTADDEPALREPPQRWRALRPSGSFLSPVTIAGVALIGIGFGSIGLAWRHISRTDQLWIQNQELLSGGAVGLGLIIVGIGLALWDQIGVIGLKIARRLDSLQQDPQALKDADTSESNRPLRPDNEAPDTSQLELVTEASPKRPSSKNGARRQRATRSGE